MEWPLICKEPTLFKEWVLFLAISFLITSYPASSEEVVQLPGVLVLLGQIRHPLLVVA